MSQTVIIKLQKVVIKRDATSIGFDYELKLSGLDHRNRYVLRVLLKGTMGALKLPKAVVFGIDEPLFAIVPAPDDSITFKRTARLPDNAQQPNSQDSVYSEVEARVTIWEGDLKENPWGQLRPLPVSAGQDPVWRFRTSDYFSRTPGCHRYHLSITTNWGAGDVTFECYGQSQFGSEPLFLCGKVSPPDNLPSGSTECSKYNGLYPTDQPDWLDCKLDHANDNCDDSPCQE